MGRQRGQQHSIETSERVHSPSCYLLNWKAEQIWEINPKMEWALEVQANDQACGTFPYNRTSEHRNEKPFAERQSLFEE